MDDLTLDEERGIQGVERRGPEERLKKARNSQTVQGRYLGGREGLVREKEQEEEELEQERILEEEELEEEENFALDEEDRILREQQAALEAQQAIQRAQAGANLNIILINRQKEKARMMLLSKIEKTKLLASRSVAKSGIAIAISIFIFVLPLAIISAIGFGLHGKVGQFTEGLGKIWGVGWLLQWGAGLVTKVLPFELVGWAAWGIAVIILLPSFLGYFIWFTFLQLNPIGSQLAFIVTCVCILGSICPFINIFPWIVLWVIYMSFFAPSA